MIISYLTVFVQFSWKQKPSQPARCCPSFLQTESPLARRWALLPGGMAWRALRVMRLRLESWWVEVVSNGFEVSWVFHGFSRFFKGFSWFFLGAGFGSFLAFLGPPPPGAYLFLLHPGRIPGHGCAAVVQKTWPPCIRVPSCGSYGRPVSCLKDELGTSTLRSTAKTLVRRQQKSPLGFSGFEFDLRKVSKSIKSGSNGFAFWFSFDFLRKLKKHSRQKTTTPFPERKPMKTAHV